MSTELRKVACFVVSTLEPRRLLIFKHPTAGYQLPAGTVELDEDALEAGAREVREETGISVDRSAGVVLGSAVMPLPKGKRILLRNDAMDPLLKRGHIVRLESQSSLSATIAREELDLRVDPPVTRTLGHHDVDPSMLGTSIDRYFVRFSYQLETAEQEWQISADGHTFTVRWAALDTIPELAGDQQLWLQTYLGDL